MDISTIIELPKDFDPTAYESIPYGAQTLFEETSPELETMAREAIRSALEVKLGKPIISREVLNKRFGLRKLGFTSDDILMGRVLVR